MRRRHGIDFVEARELWNDPDRLEALVRAEPEPRSQVIGRIGDSIWSAIITYRHETIRIISVRKARTSEKARYASG
jgi:uncharacterized protein